jgi:tRNA (guanine-N7-)-methyltransferase
MNLPTTIQEKLRTILTRKSARGGEFTLPFSEDLLPKDIRRQFPGFQKYTLEIGCGWGEFTRTMAKAEPQTLFVAIEKKLARVLRSSKIQKREGIANIRYLVLDIAWFFAGIFSAGTFDAVTINFPDPWPKARHHKHRFISPDFAETISHLARPGCRLTFASDNYRYAREVTGVFEQSGFWRNTIAPYTARGSIPGRPVSFFEEIHRREGAPIFFLEYEKL